MTDVERNKATVLHLSPSASAAGIRRGTNRSSRPSRCTGSGRPSTAGAGFAQVARYGAELYPNGTAPEVEAIIAEGDAVAVRLVMRAVTNKGEHYENTYLLWFDLEDGLVAAQWEILDFRTSAGEVSAAGDPSLKTQAGRRDGGQPPDR